MASTYAVLGFFNEPFTTKTKKTKTKTKTKPKSKIYKSLGPSGQSIPVQVSQTADGVFKAEFVPRSVGEHKVSVSVNGHPATGSPYAAKVSSIIDHFMMNEIKKKKKNNKNLFLI